MGNKKQVASFIPICAIKGKSTQKGTVKDKRDMISNRVSTKEHLEVVEKRKRNGDYEIDTIIGKDHEGVMLPINERAKGHLKRKKFSSKNPKALADGTIILLQDEKTIFKTITADNGKDVIL